MEKARVGNAKVLAIECMDYRMGRIDPKVIIRDSDSASAVHVQLPGAMVNNRMGEATIRDMLSKNPIERIYVCPHTTSSDTCSGCGAGGFVYDVYTQKQNASQTMYDALVKDFRENNTKFSTRRELEAINANLQTLNIERIVGSMGLNIKVESNLVDLAKYKADMNCDEKLLVLMYPSSQSLSSVANIEREKVYAIRALPEDMLPGVQLASNMGIRYCDMIAFSSEEYKALKHAKDLMQNDDIAGRIKFVMRKAG